MANNSLSNTKINITYASLLHANGVPIPVAGQEDIYDGAGNKSSLKLGRACNGATVCGTFTCDTLSAGNITVSNASPYVNLVETDTSRSWFIVANNSSFDIRADSITGLRPFSIAYSTGNITLNNSLSVAGALSGASLTTTGNAIAAAPTLSNHLTTKDYVDNRQVTAANLNGGQTGIAPIYGIRAYAYVDAAGVLNISSKGFQSSSRTTTGKYTLQLTDTPTGPITVFATCYNSTYNMSAAVYGVSVDFKTFSIRTGFEDGEATAANTDFSVMVIY